MWIEEQSKDVKTVAYWCSCCKIPVIREKKENQRCPICSRRMKFLSNTLRPVFPAEEKLVEILTKKKFDDEILWKGKSTYYVNGKSLRITNEEKINADDKMLRKELLNKSFSYEKFNKNIDLFVKANKEHLDYITDEAIRFIKSESEKYDIKNTMVSFSGGKDSTVVSDLVCRALPDKQIIHIFSDTTLEIESTYQYVERLKKNKQIDMHIARNNDNNFFEMAKKIGPPTMAGRWCCYMFKTGALNRKMNEIFNGRVLTFYGVRRSESATRANYNRVEEKTESVKIANQRSSAPILYWTDLEVWLYILANKIDFNIAYRYGYNRVGCWCCPNASITSELMERIYNHKKFYMWADYLREFGKQCGKEDLDDYVKQGRWKMRNGGKGVKAAYSVKLKSADCTAEENGKIYELYKDLDDNFYNMFLPFGYLQKGRTEINEMLVLHPTTMVPIVSLQPLNKRKIKIVTINVRNPRSLHARLAYQVVKYNACNQCLKCESLCRFGAITCKPDKYEIDNDKCRRCQACVNPKYLGGGCLMCRYLRTKKEI
ncbi:MAG: phosphoadenosine phosphosulfate reductase family protein [Clostridia bacterium]|nr:phosphoadenosine phosphosulfate reductase family protein [Clostridia bacterium]